jgi:hypothetical protein
MKADPEVVKQVIEYLDKVAAKIGMTADTVWPWLVRQQNMQFALAFSVLIVGVFLIPFALRISDKHHPFNDKQYGTEDVDFKRICRCGTIISAPALTIIGIIATMANMLNFLNPEYYALKALFRMIGN